MTEPSAARNGTATASMLAALALAGVVVESAAALVVRAEASRVRSFSAAGCGATDTQTVPLPREAGRILATRSDEGTRLLGRVTGEPVARLTGINVVRSPGGDSVAFTATSSDQARWEPNPCAGPGWRTELTEVVSAAAGAWAVFATAVSGGHSPYDKHHDARGDRKHPAHGNRRYCKGIST